MHPLHDCLAALLAKKIAARGFVVWYDMHGDFAPFLDELRGKPPADGSSAAMLTKVTLGMGRARSSRSSPARIWSSGTPSSRW